MVKTYWDNIGAEMELRICQKKGILSKKMENMFIELIDNSYFSFCSDMKNYQDIKNDCVLRLLETWKGYNYRKADPLSYFTEIVKRRIYLSIKELGGWKNGYEPKWYSIDSIFNNKEE